MSTQKTKQNKSYLIAIAILAVGLVASWYVGQFFIPLGGIALIVAVIGALVAVLRSHSTKK